MTAPRRVPTEVERAAAAVEAGHAWRHTANSRPGYATWPHTQPGDPSWWRREFDIPDDITVEPPPYEATLADAQAALRRVLGEHMPALGQALADLADLAAPRRRWWHRLTRRNP